MAAVGTLTDEQFDISLLKKNIFCHATAQKMIISNRPSTVPHLILLSNNTGIATGFLVIFQNKHVYSRALV